MLTTVAALVIILGLMVSLARYVRSQSSERLTAEILLKLETLMAEYQRLHDGAIPPVPPLVDADAEIDEAMLRRNALQNNLQFVQALRREVGTAMVLGELPAAIYDGRTVRDAWGSLILFFPQWQPELDLGMAPDNRPFFVSAGPDRRFLTREDNLYSYEAGE